MAGEGLGIGLTFFAKTFIKNKYFRENLGVNIVLKSAKISFHQNLYKNGIVLLQTNFAFLVNFTSYFRENVKNGFANVSQKWGKFTRTYQSANFTSSKEERCLASRKRIQNVKGWLKKKQPPTPPSQKDSILTRRRAVCQSKVGSLTFKIIKLPVLLLFFFTCRYFVFLMKLRFHFFRVGWRSIEFCLMETVCTD
jgi:hypothetical protein